jgi:hypothetical protein
LSVVVEIFIPEKLIVTSGTPSLQVVVTRPEITTIGGGGVLIVTVISPQQAICTP